MPHHWNDGNWIKRPGSLDAAAQIVDSFARLRVNQLTGLSTTITKERLLRRDATLQQIPGFAAHFPILERDCRQACVDESERTAGDRCILRELG